MKFVPLPGSGGIGGMEERKLLPEYRSGRGIGVISLGRRYFFFRKFLTVYYIPYEAISRYFRRIVAVPAKLGCCGGELRIENIVICGVDSQDAANAPERELAQIQLPGEKAALALMEELRRRAPDALSVMATPSSGTERRVSA